MHPPSTAPRALVAGALIASFLAACADQGPASAPADAAHPAPAPAESAFAAAGAADVRLDPEAGTLRYRNGDGEVALAGGAAAMLPADFPDDIYLPVDYVVDSTLAMNRDLFVGLGVREDVPVLYAAARAAMAGHGWTETLAALENNQNGLLTYEKGDRSAVLSFSRDGARTSMGLQLTALAR